MTRLSITISTLALIAALSGGAMASDLGGGLKDGGHDIFDAPKEVRWSGIYIGGSVGYGNANHDLTLQEYHGAYCFNPSGSGTTLPTGFDSFEPWKLGKDAIDPLSADGSCRDGDGEGDGDYAKIDGASRNVANLDGLNSSGIVGDVRIGADYQMNRFVVGVFGAYGFNGMDTTGSADIGDDETAGFKIEKGDEWSVGARAGFLVNERTLAYILAAYTQSEFEFSGHIGDEAGSKTVDFSGVTVGGGVEFAMTRNVFLGVEGTHTFYGEETILDTGSDENDTLGRGARLKDEIGETKVMGTLKVKLNGGLFD